MSRYDLFKAALQQHMRAREEFLLRGRLSIAAALHGFARYLEAPQGACTGCRLSDPIDSPTRVPIEHLGELQDDGWFAAGLWITDGEQVGMQLRLEFYARLDGDAVTYRTQGSKEFRVVSFDEASLQSFFQHVFEENLAFLNLNPEQLARGNSGRQIGFTGKI